MNDSNVFEEAADWMIETDRFEAAKKLLAHAVRYENRDHAFGDREVWWKIGDDVIAEGYFGGGDHEVHFHAPEAHGLGGFKGQEALDLVKIGKDAVVGRNDETGPDYYGGS